MHMPTPNRSRHSGQMNRRRALSANHPNVASTDVKSSTARIRLSRLPLARSHIPSGEPKTHTELA